MLRNTSQIFTASVQVLGDVFVQQQLTHRRPVGYLQRVNQRNLFTVKQLEQAQLRIVGAVRTNSVSSAIAGAAFAASQMARRPSSVVII